MAMKKVYKNILKNTTLSVSLLGLMVACSSDPNSPGVEYMPDMYRSPAVEAYVDYENLDESSVRKPVEGTIKFSDDASLAWVNMPYALQNTPEDYEKAASMIKSPIAFNKATVDAGKELYTKFCLHCHGEKGSGDGAVVSNGGFPPPPAYDGPLKDLPEGKMFHTITYGKGQMGSHASQLNKLERWTVIQYVKFLQNGGKMPEVTASAEVVTEEETSTDNQ